MCSADLRKLSKFIGKYPKHRLDYFDLYNLKLNDISVNLYVSRKRATKATHIHCTESGDIIWEQFYPFGGMSRPSREKKYVLKPTCDKTAISVVIIRGNPSVVVGLDGLIKSHNNTPETNKVFLMLEHEAIDFLRLISS